MPENYICIFLTSVHVDDNADSGAGGTEGEIVLASSCATLDPGSVDSQVQKLQVPYRNWYGSKDNRDWLEWSHPGSGPSIANGRPWAIPVFSMLESRMRDNLVVAFSFLEDDRSYAGDFLVVSNRVLPTIAGAVTAYFGGPDLGESAEEVTRVITDAAENSWDGDIVAVHANILRRSEDWGVGQRVATVESRDGRIRLTYEIRRIVIDGHLPVRVTLDRVYVPTDLDDDVWFATNKSDVYVAARVWGGLNIGELPNQTLRRVPERGQRELNSGGSWRPEQVIFEGPVAPFLYLEMGFWDKDPNDDDMHGMVLGTWTAPDLLSHWDGTGWRATEFRDVSRGRHLRVDFTIEPLISRYLHLNLWYSPGRHDYSCTTHPNWQSNGRASDHRSPDYEFRGFVGEAFNPDLPRPSDTIPLYSWWHRGRGDNFLTSDPRWSGDVGKVQDGYYLHRIEGYIYSPDRPRPGNTIPLFSWWHPQHLDNFTTSDREWRGDIGRIKDGYHLYRLEGYVRGSDLF